MKIILAGGTGFIGTYLASRFRDSGQKTVIISREHGDVRWDDTDGVTSALEASDLVINVAGRSVNCRYNKRNKKEILASRVDTTRILGEGISRCHTQPPLWINSSTATIYRHALDRPMTERSGVTGRGFSVDVATGWEEAFFSFRPAGTRQVALRTAIVLGRDGGALAAYHNMARFGLGGPQGSGDQMFSWIHEADLFGIIGFIRDHPSLTGVVNCAAPHPVTNRDFMTALREAVHVKAGLRSPAWMLKTGALLVGSETELLLKSRWVVPEKLLECGYTFRFDRIEAALADLCG